MELSQYTQALRAHWKLIWASVLVGVWLGGVATLLIPPTYEATSKLFVSTSGNELNSVQGNVVAQSRVVSYSELLVGEQFARRVVDTLGLNTAPGDLIGQIETSIRPDSQLLGITVTDESPEQAQLIANTMAEEFVVLVSDLETPAATTSTDSATGTTVTTTPTAPVKVTVVQTAGLTDTPIAPNPLLNLPLGAAVGLLIGLLLAMLRHVLDNTVKSGKQVEELTGAAAVGGVLYDPEMASRPLISQFTAHSGTGEAYRQIRTNLQYVSVDKPPRVLVVTSSVSGEGKTTTAINLAMVLAHSGQRVALVEADLRRPRITRYMQMVGGAGLTNVLAGNADLAELLQPWGDGKLSVLAAGPHPPNPSELLGSEHMGHLLAELRDSHDYVIIDAPPLLPVTDAAVLAVLADGAVIVTRYGSTKREQLRAAAGTLHAIGARVVGTVLNMVAPDGGGDYGYGYGYGYRYEPDPSPRDDLDQRSERRRKLAASRGRTTADQSS
ncbi:polysaccharide biosynthesis tyrosine autokinase [soil metagenome]